VSDLLDLRGRHDGAGAVVAPASEKNKARKGFGLRRPKADGAAAATLWIGPSYLVIGVIFAFPLVWNIDRSFYTTSYGRSTFVGLSNYRQIVDGGELYSSLLLTLYWTASVFIGQFLFGLLLALFFNQKLWVSRYVKPLMVLPWAIPGIVSSTAWTFLYSQSGLVNQILGPFFKTAPAWLASTKLAMPAVIVAGIWKGTPFFFLMFLAGLQTVPEELIEAARLDGANRFQVLTSVKLPSIRNIIAVTSVLGLIWTANYFDGIYLMTGGGPVNATQTLPIWIYNTAFSQFDLSEASALSVILLVIILAISVPYLLRRRNSYEL
jgi:multiple sugar transport system permease protein